MAPCLAHALLALALVHPQESGDSRSGSPRLQVWNGDEFVTVLDTFDGTPAVVPLSTTVDVMPRAVITARGIRVRLVGGEIAPEAIDVQAFEHAAAERVILTEDGPFVMSQPQLPEACYVITDHDDRSVVDPWALGRIARQDGLATAPGVHALSFGAEAPSSIVLFGAAGVDRLQLIRRDGGGLTLTIPSCRAGAGLLDPSWLSASTGNTRRPLTFSIDHPLDALQFADVRRLEDEAAVVEVLAVRRSDIAGELAVTKPTRSTEGSTTTLLITVDPAALLLGDREQPVDPRSVDSPAWLVDVAPQIGVDMVHFEGPQEQLDIRPTMGPGAAWGDVDLDGDLDLFLVAGGGREGPSLAGEMDTGPRNALLLQSSSGRFDRAEDGPGWDRTAWGMGALFVDLNGDAKLDLYIANYGPDALYRNQIDPQLAKVEGTAFDPGPFHRTLNQISSRTNGWSAGIAAADPDRDGDLDLYVTGYLLYDLEQMPPLEELPLTREDPIEMLPFAFPGESNTFYRNVGTAGGTIRLEDATDELELADTEGRGMQPVFFDYDADGTQDLYVANDVSLNRLYRVDAEGKFTDIAFQTGMDDPRGGMGVAIGDVDGDLDEDLFLTNWELEPNALYRNNVRTHASQRRRVASFRDVTVHAGFGTHGVGFTSWGAELFDLELDGDLDLFVANGYTSPDYETTGICVGQPNHLYLNNGEGRFRLATENLGAAMEKEYASRCVAACDFDRDGDIDLLVTSNNGPVQLLENRAPRAEGATWLGLQLRGRGANTYAIGARVVVRAGERAWVKSLRAGTSYLAGNPPELHFGLGAVEGPLAIEIDWPSGQRSEHTVETPGQWITIREPGE